MKNKNQIKTILGSIIILSGFSLLTGYSQESPPVIVDPAPAAAPQAPLPEQKSESRFDFFKGSELSRKQKKERLELRQKQENERKAEKEKIKAEKEKARQEKLKRLESEKKAYGLDKKIDDKSLSQRSVAKIAIHERKKQIRKTKRTKRLVEIISSEEDPLYISDASVKNAKSEYLKLRGVEIKYRLKLINQTPKIINSVLVIWERKIPFTETLTIQKQTKISKPIIPYEKRMVQYNDLDSKREGETYRVKIASVVFED